MKFASKGQRLRRDAVEAHSTRPRALLAAILSLMLFRPFILVMLFAAGGAIAASPWIEDVTVRATSEQFHKAKNVVSDGGLAETPAGSGVWKLSANAFLSGGTMWASGSSAHGPDEQPLIEFDLGVPRIVAGFHVWNYNEKNYTGRGFRDATVQVSDDAQRWRTLPQQFRFAEAPGRDDYAGERHVFAMQVAARYLRFVCDANYRHGGNPDASGLGKVRFFAGERAAALPAETGAIPADAGAINVLLPPYSAKGDGVADDTDALQRALLDWQGSRRAIHLPAGTYLVSRPLRLRSAVGGGQTRIVGDGREETIVRLRDGALPDAAKPQPVLSFGFNGDEKTGKCSADWFNNFVTDLTIDTGRGNPGAIALDFYSNNTGIARDLTLRSGDGAGAIGLDLGSRDQNGPLLAKNIVVRGFRTGVRCGASVNSQTLESVSVEMGGECGLENHGQCLAVRGFNYFGKGVAVKNHQWGFLTLLDVTFRGSGDAAIVNEATLFARKIDAAGFANAIVSKHPVEVKISGPNVTEWMSHPARRLFGEAAPASLALEAPETPSASEDDPRAWANVRNFRLTDDPDDTASVRRAVESGATTIYFPAGTFFLSEKIALRGKLRRVLGFGTVLAGVGGKGALSIADGDSPVVELRDFACAYGAEVAIENASARTMVVRNVQEFAPVLSGKGDAFFENTVGPPLAIHGQRVWARQFNQEAHGTKIINDAGRLWIFGMKSEVGGTLIETSNGGVTELLGGLYYTHEGHLAPMFVVRDATLSATIGEVCYTGDPFKILVSETHRGETRELPREGTPSLTLFRAEAK